MAVIYTGEFEAFQGELGEILTKDGAWLLVQFRPSVGRMWVTEEDLEHV